jgi:hypothetical protein
MHHVIGLSLESGPPSQTTLRKLSTDRVMNCLGYAGTAAALDAGRFLAFIREKA